MVTRKITNEVIYREKLDGDSYLTTTKYNRRIYLWGIRLLNHCFEENHISTIDDATNKRSMGFAKPNKNS